jgi:DNA polymerase-4
MFYFCSMSRLIAHLDMNSFFASVEQQANPFLRGRPLGVCAYLHRKGCVIAASVEAKERGMKVGMTVEDAREKVPNAVFVQNDPAKYRAVTSRVFSILHELSDEVEHYSIDEAFLDLTGWYRDAAEAAWAFARVRRRIYQEVGEWLRCSIGIAPTRFLAKLGSDYQKPSGLTVVTPENLDEILAHLELEDVNGIGPRMRKRISRLGYQTPLELRHAPLGNLIHAFGQYGYMMWMKLNGHEVEDVVGEAPPPKSIGHSHCVPNSVNRDGKVEAVFTKLVDKAARRLRGHGLLAGTVIASVGLRSGGGDYDFVHLAEPADDSFSIVDTAIGLLRDMWDGRQPVSFLAITLTDLEEPNGQLRLGIASRQSRVASRQQALSHVADLVRDKHGDASLFLGKLWGVTVDDAPDRIGFRKTNGVDVGDAWKGVR